MTGSIRVRVTALAALVVLAVLVAVGVLAVVLQRAALIERLDDTVDQEAERLVELAAAGATPELDDDLLAVVLVDGEPVAAGEDLREEPGELARLVAADGDEIELDGDPHRIGRAGDDGIDVIVAASTDDVGDTVGQLARTLVLLVPAAVLVLAVAVWLLVGRTLRPVERMRVEVDGVRLDELHRRIAPPAGDDEISRLAVTLNTMLERLEGAHTRQQRFVADASHELRTPLARIRTELEVDERHPETADPDTTRRSVLDEVDRLQRLVADLLVLARRDAGAHGPRRPVDLDEVVRAEVAGDSIDTTGVQPVQVLGDETELRRVVRNLLDNARRHAAGGIAVAVADGPDGVVLTVDDDGPGIAPERRAEVFERFRRLDDARGAGDGGAGLGLAIVRSIVEAHGGSVEVTDSVLGGARLAVHLPAAM